MSYSKKTENRSEALQAETRWVWVDHARGIGIFLVVFGHVFIGLMNASIIQTSGGNEFVCGWIYSFHMPLFFFLSGMFVLRSARKPLTLFLNNKLRTIVYPYFVWSIIQSSIQVPLSSYTNKAMDFSEIISIVYKPVMQFWFLYVLFVMFVIFIMLHRLGTGAKGFFYVSVCCLILPSLISLGSWGVPYQVCRYMIYFGLGAAASSRILTRPWPANRSVQGLVSFFCFAGLGMIVKLDWTEYGFGALIAATMGICGVVYLARVLERVESAAFLKRWGRYSLEIFVAHTLAASGFRIVLQKLLHINAPALHLIGGIACGIVIPLMVIKACQRIRFPYAFALPKKAEAF